MEENVKKTVMKLIKPIQIINLATSLNNQPYVRPLTMLKVEENHYIATGSEDNKIFQIRTNPLFELSIDLKDKDSSGYIRLSGRVDIVEDLAEKTLVYNSIDFLKHYWDSPKHPGYGLLRLSFDAGEYLPVGSMIAKRFTF